MARGKSNAGYDHIVNSARGLPKIRAPRAVAPPTAPKVPRAGGKIRANATPASVPSIPGGLKANSAGLYTWADNTGQRWMSDGRTTEKDAVVFGLPAPRNPQRLA